MARRLLGVEETSDYLGLKRGTLYAWAHNRKIPSVKMGRRLLFDICDLEKLIEVGRRPISEQPIHQLLPRLKARP